jgi:sphingolipid delta-4 desaturase
MRGAETPSQVGYHNEHHDFPSIPWTRLPALRALAPEFYDTLPAHPSWVGVIVNFLCDAEVGIYARVKREQGLRAREALAAAGKVERGSKIVVCEEDGEESDKSA